MWCLPPPHSIPSSSIPPPSIHPPPPSLMQSVDTTSLGVTTFLDFTRDITDTITHVGNYSNVSQCCSYQYQLLDQFCANRMAVSVWCVCGVWCV